MLVEKEEVAAEVVVPVLLFAGGDGVGDDWVGWAGSGAMVWPASIRPHMECDSCY